MSMFGTHAHQHIAAGNAPFLPRPLPPASNTVGKSRRNLTMADRLVMRRHRSLWTLLGVAAWSTALIWSSGDQVHPSTDSITRGRPVSFYSGTTSRSGDDTDDDDDSDSAQVDYVDRSSLQVPIAKPVESHKSGVVPVKAISTVKVDLENFRNSRTKKRERPPLRDLISDEEMGIKSDVKFMMDFAILG